MKTWSFSNLKITDLDYGLEILWMIHLELVHFKGEGSSRQETMIVIIAA